MDSFVTLVITINLHNMNLVIYDQIFMSKFLDISHFRNGDEIKEARTNEEWRQADLNGEPVWCHVNNDPENQQMYGKLYNWHAVADSRGLAPEGWAIPAVEQFELLIKNIDENYNLNPNPLNLTLEHFAGARTHEGNFLEFKEVMYCWSSTNFKEDGKIALVIEIKDNLGSFKMSLPEVYEGSGFSVRCIRENTVVIGSQEWMIENLDVDKFSNGDQIEEIKTWDDLTNFFIEKKPGWCNYHFYSPNGHKHGKLYNWWAVNDPRGLAPPGFHIPNVEEWNELIEYLGNDDQTPSKLKSFADWRNQKNSNFSGFTALPSGFIDPAPMSFLGNGSTSVWWSSTLEKNYWPFVLYLDDYLELESWYCEVGLSVRLIKDNKN